MSAQKKKHITHLALLMTGCGVFLLIMAVGSLIVRCRTLEMRLDEMLLESLASHTQANGESAQQLIDDTQMLLEDAVLLLEEDGRLPDKSWTDPLLKAVNLGDRKLEIHYLTMEELSDAEPGSEEHRVFRQLQEGESVVSGSVSRREEF